MRTTMICVRLAMTVAVVSTACSAPVFDIGHMATGESTLSDLSDHGHVSLCFSRPEAPPICFGPNILVDASEVPDLETKLVPSAVATRRATPAPAWSPYVAESLGLMRTVIQTGTANDGVVMLMQDGRLRAATWVWPTDPSITDRNADEIVFPLEGRRCLNWISVDTPLRFVSIFHRYGDAVVYTGDGEGYLVRFGGNDHWDNRPRDRPCFDPPAPTLERLPAVDGKPSGPYSFRLDAERRPLDAHTGTTTFELPPLASLIDDERYFDDEGHIVRIREFDYVVDRTVRLHGHRAGFYAADATDQLYALYPNVAPAPPLAQEMGDGDEFWYDCALFAVGRAECLVGGRVHQVDLGL